jgi:hypothetical protein
MSYTEEQQQKLEDSNLIHMARITGKEYLREQYESSIETNQSLYDAETSDIQREAYLEDISRLQSLVTGIDSTISSIRDAIAANNVAIAALATKESSAMTFVDDRWSTFYSKHRKEINTQLELARTQSSTSARYSATISRPGYLFFQDYYRDIVPEQLSIITQYINSKIIDML